MMKSEQQSMISALHSSESNLKPMPSPSPSPSPSLSKKKKKYKGVRMRSWGSWVSEIRAPNQKTRIWLGSYSTPEAAARAYDAALLCLKGSSASNLINFPLNASYYHHYLPLNYHDDDDNANISIMSPKSIQRVAAAAANANMFPSGTPPPPPSSALSSSSSSSPSPSELVLDDDFIGGELNGTPTMMMGNDPWIDFDPIMNDMFFDPPSMSYNNMAEVYEEGAFSLWSFY